MADDLELDKAYSKSLHEFRNTLSAMELFYKVNAKQEDMLRQLLVLEADHVKILSGIYSELVEARHDRRKTPQN